MKRLKITCLNFKDYFSNINKFYIAELLEKTPDSAYVLITRYGRCGKNPNVSEKSFTNEHVALREYQKIVNSKIKKGYSCCSMDDIRLDNGSW